MTAVWAWARVDLRQRGRSLIVLGLLVALATGVVVTAVAGARRGSSAVDRLLARTEPATVAALPNQPGFDWDAVEDLPGVAALTRFAVTDVPVEGLEGGVVDFPYGEGTMRELERPVVLEGRLADEARVDEAVITSAFEESFGRGVGDTVTLHLLTPEQADESYLSDAPVPEPGGPRLEVTIVGVVRSAWFSEVGAEDPGRLVISNALLEQYGPNLVGAEGTVNVNALVRLSEGAAGIPAFREALAEVSGRNDIEFMDLAGEAHHLSDVTDFEAGALLGFAVAALVAALFLVGSAVIRSVGAIAGDLRILQAVGLRPRHARVAAAIGPTLAAIAGAVIGLLGAFAVSDRFPTGSARPIEPTPGRAVDLLVSVAALLLVPAAVALGAMASSWVVDRSFVTGRERRSRIAGVLARAGAPVPVTVGTSFALDRGRGAQAVPVLPAVVGAVVGVMGVIAALTFAAGVRDATDHPERFGQVADLQAFMGFGGEDFAPPEALEVVAADPDVVAVNDSRQGVLESGAVDMAAYALAPVGDGTLPIVVLTGDRPRTPDEVLLGTETAARLAVAPGDTIEVVGSKGSGSLRVSGIGFVPEGSHNGYDAGAWVPVAAYDRLIDGFKFHVADVVVREGADPLVVADRVAVALAEVMGAPPEEMAGFLAPPTPPSRLRELRQVQRLPLLLAAFLALLAVAAVGHALSSSVRRRRHDLAVLRAVGVTRGHTRLAIVVQGVVLALIGLTFGVPLGLALGRLLWRSVADSTPLEYVPPMALLALALVGPIVLLAAVALAAWPSHQAARLCVAHVLRTE